MSLVVIHSGGYQSVDTSGQSSIPAAENSSDSQMMNEPGDMDNDMDDNGY